jgi:hypothetical protein
VTLALSDKQLRYITTAAQPLDPSKRTVFLERVASHLTLTHGWQRPSDRDLQIAIKAALHGLLHGSAA